MAQGEGMHFILPSRDLIAGSIQAMASAHGFDGLVFLCSCDKIVPGMLMAAAALNKPCMFLTAGSMLPYEADEGTYVTPDLKESIGQRNIDAISEETFTRFRENICFSCGTCSMYGTANTMGVFAEVIGLCPIDSTTMLFCSSAKYKQARDVGERIVTPHEGGGALFRHRHRGEPQERPAPRRRDRRLDERPAPHLRARARDGYSDGPRCL